MVNMEDDVLTISDGESKVAGFSAQARTVSKQQVKASSQTITDKSLSNSKPTTTKNLKRSADHFAASDAPSSKK